MLVCGGRHYGMIPKDTPRHTPQWYIAQSQAEDERRFMGYPDLSVETAIGRAKVNPDFGVEGDAVCAEEAIRKGSTQVVGGRSFRILDERDGLIQILVDPRPSWVGPIWISRRRFSQLIVLGS